MSRTAFAVNPTLTAVAIGYMNPDVALIADRVLPRVASPYEFAYTTYSLADAYTVPPTRVGRKSAPNVVDFGGTQVTGRCVDWALDVPVPELERAAWESMAKPATGGPVDPQVKATRLATSLIQLDREIRVANTVFNTATYPGGNQATLSGTSQWSDFTNSNPLDAMLTALDVPVMRPNTVVLGQQAWTKVRQHPRLIQAANASAQTGGAITRQQLADLLEVQQVLIGASFVNNARPGQTPTLTRVWGKHAALLFVSEDMANADQPQFGATMQFGTRLAGEIEDRDLGMRGGVRVRVGESVQEVITAPAVGYLFQNAVA